MLCAICAVGLYCWLHDSPAIDDGHGSVITPRPDADVLDFRSQPDPYADYLDEPDTETKPGGAA